MLKMKQKAPLALADPGNNPNEEREKLVNVKTGPAKECPLM